MKTGLGPIAVAALCGLIACLVPAHAQAPAPVPGVDIPRAASEKPRAPSTRSERAAAQAGRRKQMMERDAVLRKKRAACLEERKEKKIPIFDRPRFIRECMARP